MSTPEIDKSLSEPESREPLPVPELHSQEDQERAGDQQESIEIPSPPEPAAAVEAEDDPVASVLQTVSIDPAENNAGENPAVQNESEHTVKSESIYGAETSLESASGSEAEKKPKTGPAVKTSGTHQSQQPAPRQTEEKSIPNNRADAKVYSDNPSSELTEEVTEGVVYAKPGDLIQYPFMKPGWVFNRTEPDSGGLKFVEKRSGLGNRVTFVFEAIELGSYILEFISYDMSSGTEYVKNVPVHIVKEEEFLDKVEYSDVSEAREGAKSLFDEEEYLSVIEYYKEHPPAGPEDQLILAVSEKQTGDYDSAVIRLEKLLGETQTRRTAMEELTDLALQPGRADLLLRLMKENDFLSLTHSPDALLRMGEIASEERRPDLGIPALRLVFEEYADYKNLDRVLWLLGNMLEMPGRFRDVQGAVKVYFLILDHYPVSKYYEPARDRVTFLKRHYILIN